MLRHEMIQTVVVAQLVRAPDCGSGGRGFETHLPPKCNNDRVPRERDFFIGDMPNEIYFDEVDSQ